MIAHHNKNIYHSSRTRESRHRFGTFSMPQTLPKFSTNDSRKYETQSYLATRQLGSACDHACSLSYHRHYKAAHQIAHSITTIASICPVCWKNLFDCRGWDMIFSSFDPLIAIVPWIRLFMCELTQNCHATCSVLKFIENERSTAPACTHRVQSRRYMNRISTR